VTRCVGKGWDLIEREAACEAKGRVRLSLSCGRQYLQGSGASRSRTPPTQVGNLAGFKLGLEAR